MFAATERGHLEQRGSIRVLTEGFGLCLSRVVVDTVL